MKIIRLLLVGAPLSLAVDLKLPRSQILDDLAPALSVRQGDFLKALLFLELRLLDEEHPLVPLHGVRARSFEVKLPGQHAGLQAFTHLAQDLVAIRIQVAALLVHFGEKPEQSGQAKPLAILQALAEAKNGLERKAECHDVSSRSP